MQRELKKVLKKIKVDFQKVREFKKVQTKYFAKFGERKNERTDRYFESVLEHKKCSKGRYITDR